ncbi:MAG: class I SAM-dependent methyltransferase [Alphaproteobacteria bacterium]|nr:class I SAM-dependent methyltransferase [Alphaproteobacteria bacterium]
MSLFDIFLRRVILNGTLTVVDYKGKSQSFGTPAPDHPDVTIRMNDSGAAGAIVRNPALGAGEGYVNGRFSVDGDDIMGLVELVQANTRWESGRPMERPNIVKESARALIGKLDRINQRARSKANVAHHYDLSGRLYELFLDMDRQYSCAYFTDPANSLDQAQEEKKAHIAAKLALKPGQQVLDIGCGWGGMALYLHEKCGVDVLGITLSEEQLKVAQQRAEAAGVADHVKFELIDYRDVAGRFDRIVSVGMFEHVGTSHYNEFFRHCHNLLTNDGVMLLHTIGRLDEPGVTDAWTRKYIFPGGYCPSLSEIAAASEPNKLMVSDVEVLRLHYAMTIHQWYARVEANRYEIVKLYDERFYRMWKFYLAGAATAFEHGNMVVYQIQYLRDRRALPITRDYMASSESRLRASTAL